MGRVAAIAIAAIAGIASIPALLGSDRPPPVPRDVGLPPPAVSRPVTPPQPPAPIASAAEPRRAKPELARREKPPERPHRHRHRQRPRTRQRADRTQKTPLHPPALASPPVYSYSPPPSSSDNLGIEG